MKNRILLAGLASLALSAPILAALPAQASCCVAYDYTDSKQQTKTVVDTLSERINAMQLAIIEAMRLGTGQLSGNLKEQIGSESNMKNVEDDRRVVGNVEMARFNAIRSAASGASSCNSTTAGLASGGLNNNVSTLVSDITNDLVDWDLGADDQMPSARGTDVAVQSRLEKHCSLYANKDDVKSGLCPSNASIGEMSNADIDVAKSLFGGMGVKRSEAQTYSEERQKAAYFFLINAIDPRPQGAMLPKEATSPGGREKAAARQAAAARLSIAKYSAGDIYARRHPQKNAKLTSWAQGTAGQISGYKGVTFSNGVSWHDAQDIKARSWYQNPNWGTAIASQSAEQATKDSAHILAYNAYLQWETYKLIEKQNLMLASMLSMMTEQSRGHLQATN